MSSVFGWTSIYTVVHALPHNFGPHCSIFTYFRLKYKPPSIRKGLIPGTTVEEIAYTRKKRLFDVASFEVRVGHCCKSNCVTTVVFGITV